MKCQVLSYPVGASSTLLCLGEQMSLQTCCCPDRCHVLQSKVAELQKSGELQRRWDSFQAQDVSVSMVSWHSRGLRVMQLPYIYALSGMQAIAFQEPSAGLHVSMCPLALQILHHCYFFL